MLILNSHWEQIFKIVARVITNQIVHKATHWRRLQTLMAQDWNIPRKGLWLLHKWVVWKCFLTIVSIVTDVKTTRSGNSRNFFFLQKSVSLFSQTDTENLYCPMHYSLFSASLSVREAAHGCDSCSWGRSNGPLCCVYGIQMGDVSPDCEKKWMLGSLHILPSMITCSVIEYIYLPRAKQQKEGSFLSQWRVIPDYFMCSWWDLFVPMSQTSAAFQTVQNHTVLSSRLMRNCIKLICVTKKIFIHISIPHLTLLLLERVNSYGVLHGWALVFEHTYFWRQIPIKIIQNQFNL